MNASNSNPSVTSSTNSPRQIGLFTRLAVELSSSKRYFHTTEGQEWLSAALKTASRTSIASVLNLSKKPDVWFILIDETLPKSCVEQINSVFNKIQALKVEIVKLSDWATSASTLLSEIERFKDFQVQIRLDYDDMLHRDFLELLLQKTVDVVGTTILSPNCGIVLDNRSPKMAIIKKDLPPFLVLVRSDRNDQTNIYSFDHDSWPNYIVREIGGNPMWLQSITGRNLANEFGRGWMVSRVRHLSRLDLFDWNGERVIYRSPKPLTVFLNIFEAITEFKERWVLLIRLIVRRK